MGTCLGGTARARGSRRSGRAWPSPLLRTAALVAIPGLGSPGTTRHLMGEALGGSIWDPQASEQPGSGGSSDEEQASYEALPDR